MRKEKSAIRKYLLERRNTLSRQYVQEASLHICKKLDAYLLEYIKEHHPMQMRLFAYMAKDNELDLSQFLQNIFARTYKKQYGVDIVLSFPKVFNKDMNFFVATSMDDFEMGTFGIQEPTSICKKIEPCDGDHILVPALGFNRDYARIGYGAGYYDRYFKNRSHLNLIGLTYDFSSQLDFFADAHDIVMQDVITDK